MTRGTKAVWAMLMLVIVTLAAPCLRAEDAAGQKGWLTASADAMNNQAEPSTSRSPASALASAPAEEPAAASWPPGLLMDGLDAIGFKKAMDAMGLRAYGSVETSFTGRLTGGQEPLPGRLLDARRVNNLRFNQLWLTLERPYDKEKSFDVGGRADVIYGGDAFWTRALGLNRMGEGNGENWFDPIQFYAQSWLKTGKESGFELQVGKFLGTIGYESTDAALSPFYSHGFLFNTMGPFSETGAQAKYYFNSEWSAYFAVVNGWDDFEDNNHAHSYVTGAAWNSADQLDGHSRSSALLNLMTGPEQQGNVHNFRTVVDGTYTYWWTSKLSETINADYLTEEGGAPDGSRSRSYGAAHYLSYIFNERYTGTWRAEWVRDCDGVRLTGSSANLYEMTWGVAITPWPNDKVLKNLLFRPEFRWDFADQPVFCGGRENQLTAAMDIIFKF